MGDSPFGNWLPKGYRLATRGSLVVLTPLLALPVCFYLRPVGARGLRPPMAFGPPSPSAAVADFREPEDGSLGEPLLVLLMITLIALKYDNDDKLYYFNEGGNERYMYMHAQRPDVNNSTKHQHATQRFEDRAALEAVASELRQALYNTVYYIILNCTIVT